jgi:uncharacterized membrane protein YadS
LRLARIHRRLAARRLLRVPAEFAAIAATAVVICGVSAARSGVRSCRESAVRDGAFVCVAVSLIGTITMIVYPRSPSWRDGISLLRHVPGCFDPRWHRLSVRPLPLSTANSRYSPNFAGGCSRRWSWWRGWSIRRHLIDRNDPHKASVETLPKFLMVFIALVAIGSFVPWPQQLVDSAAVISRYCLLTAVAALGLLTHTGSLLRLGWQPVVLMVALTLVIAVVAALGVSV